MTKCKKCGREIADGDKYCISCNETKDHKVKFWAKVGFACVAVMAAVASVFVGKKDES